MKKWLFLALTITISLSSCIKDDFVFDTVDPVLRITSTVDSIAIGSSFQFEAMYLNNIGIEEIVNINWKSSQPGIVSINENGLAQALAAGNTSVTISYNDGTNTLADTINVAVGEATVIIEQEREGTIVTTSSYLLTGDFTVTTENNNLLLSIASNYQASTALPGLYVYLSNNRNSVANALEIGKVEVFSGAHSYSIPNLGINEYDYLVYFCKPFNVKVGDGEIQ